MRKFRLFNPDNLGHLALIGRIAKLEAEQGLVASSEYLYPRSIGINKSRLKGLYGYALASALRSAADHLDELASMHEQAEDARVAEQMKSGGDE